MAKNALNEMMKKRPVRRALSKDVDAAVSLATPVAMHDIEKAFLQFSGTLQDLQTPMRDALAKGELMGIAQMFNVLYGVLCDLHPDFEISNSTNLGDLVHEVVNARPEWFANRTSRSDFWEALEEHDLPHSNYFTIQDRIQFEEIREPDQSYTLHELRKWVQGQEHHSLSLPEEFNFISSQEADVLGRSGANRGADWREEIDRGALVYEPLGGTHRVEVWQSDQDMQENLDMETLRKLVNYQDADFVYVMLYIAAALAPQERLPENLTSIGWLDLDEIMKKIGWYPNKLTLVKRNEQRRKIWNYLVYGDRAIVVGQRNVPYYDKVTKEEISTRISSPMWRIMSMQNPIQQSMLDEVPRRVQLAISKEWEHLLTSRDLAQYLPMADVIGRIPPNKVGGDWARSIALVLARLWRMKPKEIIRPTRQELLTRYKPKTKTVDELLGSDKPKRAVVYWREALNILAEVGFINREGEVMRTVAEMLKPHRSYGWQEAWLQEKVDITPGPLMMSFIQERSDALPAMKPKKLDKPQPRKRGRPAKNRS